MKELEKTPTRHLVDPFREWFMSDSEVEKLMKKAEAERAKAEAESGAK